MFTFAKTMPDGIATIMGNEKFPDIKGRVSFYGVHGGTIIVAEVKNLPEENQFHGFHIHEGNDCRNAGQHYTKVKVQHPEHAGDMPPLLACDGTAFLAFYTNRFYPEDIIGRTVVIHERADDFMSQPSGNPGEMIACGVVE